MMMIIAAGAAPGSRRTANGASCDRRSTRAALPAQTPIKIGGPAAGDDSGCSTSDDPTGKLVRGTLNNCAMGFTPWGTYLTCEENFHGFFYTERAPNIPNQGDPDERTHLEKRYGISPFNSGFRWHTTDPRFNADIEPNEPNRFGWVVEIDPFEPKSTPVKRTALGRFKHEGAWVQETKGGRIVVYMGDDERNEYIYRYVSNLPWRLARWKGINPLDDGILYVGRFNADGTGDWLPLAPGSVPPTPDHPMGWSVNDILINTRGAADAVGATMMDRPEWIDTFPARAHRDRHPYQQQPPRHYPAFVQQPRRQHNGWLGAATCGHRQSARQQRVRAHHNLEIRRGLDRAGLRVGDFRSVRRPDGPRPRLDDRRRQVRFAGRHLCGAERQTLDPDRRVGLDDQRR